jgi:uncharacterized protein YjbJ (UPF0337 family)
MSNFGEKIKGEAEVIGGAIEKTAGKVLGNEKLKDAGAAREAKGKAEKAGEPMPGEMDHPVKKT